MNDPRPIETIPDFELRAWMKSPWNKRFRVAWSDMAPIMRARFSRRSVSQKVFALGYLAGQRAIRSEIETFPGKIEMAGEKLVKDLSDRLELVTRLSKLD